MLVSTRLAAYLSRTSLPCTALRYLSTKPPPPPSPSSPLSALGTDLSSGFIDPSSSARAVIDAIGPSSFTISGVHVTQSVLVLSHMSTFWNVKDVKDLKPDAFMLLKLIVPRPDVVLVGTGKEIILVERQTREFLNELGVSLECMDTKNACHTFNVLNQEGRNVAAALLPAGYEQA